MWGLLEWQNVVFLAGLFTLIKFILVTAWSIYVGFKAHVLSRWKEEDLVESYGKWAVVTGSTDGIGKCYAQELAKKGINIILISRTMEKLQRLATEIAEQYGVETDILQVDFSLGRKVYKEIEERLEGKDIGFLVNNVGVIHPYPMKFEEVSEDSLWSHVNVNVGAILAMTKLVLPGMLERKKGAIVNLASIAARLPVPMLQVYAATKAFDEYFSEALGVEYEESGITVQTITPSYVSTAMTHYSDTVHKPSLLVPTAETFARSAVATLGHTHYTTGYWAHGLQAWFMSFLPRCVGMKVFLSFNEKLKNEWKAKSE